MVVKNSAKLTLSRGKVSVKSLIYDIVVLLVLAAVLVAVLIPAFSDVAAEIAELDIPAKLQQIVANATSVAQSEAAVAEFVGAIEAALNIFVRKFLVNTIIIVFFAAIITRILFGLKTLPMMDVVNAYMSTNSEYDFVSNFVHNLKPSLKYSLVYALVCLPFDAALFAFILFGVVPTISALGLFGMPVVVITICAIFTLRRVFLSNWVPEMLMNGGRVWHGLGVSIKEGAKNFFTYAWQFFAYAVIVWSILVLLGVSTFGVGAVIAVPVVGLFAKVYDLVDYYERKGIRYYAEAGDVVVPQGAENTDN